MTGANAFFDFVISTKPLIQAWEKEIDNDTEFKAQLHSENKPFVFMDIKINNAYKRLAMVSQLIELASNAISEIPKPTEKLNRQDFTAYDEPRRTQIKDLPRANGILEDIALQVDDNNYMLSQILDLLKK
jgi:hypothetical protein